MPEPHWLRALPPGLRARVEADPEAEPSLLRACEEARRAFPGLEFDAARLAEHLMERMADEVPLPVALSARHLADLSLSFAALAGHPPAVDRVQAIVSQELRVAMTRIRSTLSLDEAAQRVTTKLLLPDEGPPRLALYRGEGELRAWVRVVATRLLLNAATRGPKERPLDEHVLDVVGDGGDDPELLYIKQLYRSELKEAFAQGVSVLSSRERALLRFAIIDALTVDEIGRLYDVHRATAARWVTAAREALEKATLGALRLRWRVDEAQLRAIVGLVKSQLDLSITRVLRESG